MRDRLIHGYDVADLDILWDTVDLNLSVLIGLLEETLEKR